MMSSSPAWTEVPPMRESTLLGDKACLHCPNEGVVYSIQAGLILDLWVLGILFTSPWVHF